MENSQLDSKNYLLEKVIESLESSDLNEFIRTNDVHYNYDIRNNIDYPLLAKYHEYLEQFAIKNNTQKLFWGEERKGLLKTWDRIYFFQKLRFIEILDKLPHNQIVQYWAIIFSRSTEIFQKEYKEQPDTPQIHWSEFPMIKEITLPEHFNLWAINNYPLFPCTNGEVRLMSETILPNPDLDIISKYLPVLAVDVDDTELKKVTHLGKQVFRFKEKPDNKDLKVAMEKMIADNNKDLELKTKLIVSLMD